MEQCEESNETPTQEGFLEWAAAMATDDFNGGYGMYLEPQLTVDPGN